MSIQGDGKPSRPDQKLIRSHRMQLVFQSFRQLSEDKDLPGRQRN